MECFESSGYCVLELLDPNPVHQVRSHLTTQLRNFLRAGEVQLETYHEAVDDDDQHIQIQAHLTELLRSQAWHVEIFRRNTSVFAELLGPDLDIQKLPYLRIARPNKTQDNIGFHRDTVYGGSPYELSVFVPFVNVEVGMALQVEPGSHLKGESEIPFVQIQNPDKSVVKGSTKHKIGFPYAPQVLAEDYPLNMVAIPLRLGQVLVFTLALLHGAVVNQSRMTRWSTDVRIKNAFAPVGARASADIYMPLERSQVARAAENYLKVNRSSDHPKGRQP